MDNNNNLHRCRNRGDPNMEKRQRKILSNKHS